MSRCADRRRPRGLPGPAPVDHQRLPPLPRVADPDRRLSRRPARPAPGVRHRHDLVRARVAAVRAGPQRRGADPGPGAPGDRRRAPHARQPGNDRGAFRAEDRSRAIGAWSGLGGIAAALGPLVGGLLVGHASWRWIFVVDLPLAALTVWLAQHWCRNTRPARQPLRRPRRGARLRRARRRSRGR